MAHLTRLFVLFLFAVTASTASAQAPSCTANDPDIACTMQGEVRGVEGDMLAFKGRRGLPNSECLAPVDEAGAATASHGMANWRRQSGCRGKDRPVSAD